MGGRVFVDGVEVESVFRVERAAGGSTRVHHYCRDPKCRHNSSGNPATHYGPDYTEPCRTVTEGVMQMEWDINQMASE